MYCIHNTSKVVSINVDLEWQDLLELENQAEDHLVCGNKMIVFVVCPVKQHAVKQNNIPQRATYMSGISLLLLLSTARFPQSAQSPSLKISWRSVPKQMAILVHRPFWQHAFVNLMGVSMIVCRTQDVSVKYSLVFRLLWHWRDVLVWRRAIAVFPRKNRALCHQLACFRYIANRPQPPGTRFGADTGG
jgi:hypothetical protein